MHGHGHAPPQPGRPADSTLVALRTLFVALTVLSCGFLAWAPLLRLAVITRRILDWVLFGVVVLLTIGVFVFLGETVPEDEKQEMSDGAALTFGGWMIGTILTVTVYYLIVEIRHFGRLAPPQPVGYGYPPVTPPIPSAFTQPMHTPMPQRPAQPSPPQPQPATPPPAKPPSQRIDQVRAELDELSDLLRNDPRDPWEERR
ncbi:hypothetical protein AMK26_27480 [Streptomyces sp. CB03234]|uniref:hypothetical protein n=1 Tax=Streptomyces sp. (strain CB03234) TaxID=1703937 RepID=UPI000940329C|nr:hypothetical protein [Streptomyces sp. CB03234]OKJ99741.1 hypothetical protein AMK26_27480 [Streptomyces sp. CB03234]